MSFFPDFNLRQTVRLPNVKLKLISVFIAFAVAAIGWGLASLQNDALWFSRFGALVVLVAAFFAYFSQLDEKNICKWAKDSRDKMVFDADIQADLDWFDRKAIEAAGQNWDDALARMSSPLSDSDHAAILTATGLGAASKTAEDSLISINNLLKDPMKRDRLAEYLNRRLRTLELSIGAIGTIIWGFGDLLHKVV